MNMMRRYVRTAVHIFNQQTRFLMAPARSARMWMKPNVYEMNGYVKGWPIVISKRHMWRMLSRVFNRPDQERIKELGADRGCAEWCLRCGAHVKWVGSDKWQTDYNTLPASNFKRYKVEEINADDAGVMDLGFEHLEGLKHLKKIRLHYCAYLDDGALFELKRVKDSLEHLEIGNCGDISNEGLASLGQLQNLKTLVLYHLSGVRNKEAAYKKLQGDLPNCEIDYRDIQQKEQT